jgi:hypothetical protein
MSQPMPAQPTPGHSGADVPGQPGQPPQGQPRPSPGPGGMPPPVAPMCGPPAQPLPAIPRPMTPPYPKTSGQALQEANLLGFLAAQHQPGMGPAEDRKHQNLALGSQRAVSRNVLGLRQNLVGTGAQTLDTKPWARPSASPCSRVRATPRTARGRRRTRRPTARPNPASSPHALTQRAFCQHAPRPWRAVSRRRIIGKNAPWRRLGGPLSTPTCSCRSISTRKAAMTCPKPRFWRRASRSQSN